MITPKLVLKVLPWLLLFIMVFMLYLTNHWPFGNKEKEYQHIVDTSIILDRVENLGRLELIRYNYKEVFEYKRLSNGKIIGTTMLQTYAYDPDVSVILVASGEAVGCIDLTLLKKSDIHIGRDSIMINLPDPELCYHKLNLDDTKIYSFSNKSWWSKLFSDSDEKNEILQMAYQKAEERLEEAAIESGIYQSTNENVELILKPMLEQITGKRIHFITSIPAIHLTSPN